MRRTKKVVRVALATVVVVLVVLVAWGLLEPRFLDVERHAVRVPDLPDAWNGAVVAQLSDFQIGIVLDNRSTIEAAVERILEEEPALVLLTGDFVYHSLNDSSRERRAAASYVRPLTGAGIPTYAVLGNHDYNVPHERSEPNPDLARRVRESLENVGVVVLENDAVALPAPDGAEGDQPLFLVGVGPSWPERARPDEALAMVPDGAPRLCMMHNPDAFAHFPAGAAPFAVAGHTHGGQVRLPFLPAWSWLTWIRPGSVHADGWIDDYGAEGNALYVNRGIGMGFLPIRIRCAPELTLFTLEWAGG